MPDPEPFNAPVIVDPQGRPARREKSALCPVCSAGPDHRRASSGFGRPHPICASCGYAFTEERWHG